MKISVVFTVFLTIIYYSITGQIPERIEPPGWWIGMKDPGVQIMVYGKGVGKLIPHINHRGIKLVRSSSPDNPDYLFIDLLLKPNTRPGKVPIKLFDGKKEITTIEYPIYKRKPGSATREGFNSGDVIYLITPDRFVNGDPANDNVAGLKETANRSEKFGRHGGDIQGIRQSLEYIKDMGFTSIWLNPVLENDMPKSSYHGYATTDFYRVDPRMGTNETYKALCDEASQKGIKMIMDMITNHCGSFHWWMKSPPTKDWINYFDQSYIETNHRKTISIDPYASNEDREVLTDGWFVPTMPDLNTKNPYLIKYLIQNAIWWIEYAGLSGIRMDTYLYPDEDFMSEWSRRIMNEYPLFNITGEVWHDNPAIVSYWQKGKLNANGYVSYLPSLFDFPIQSALIKALMSEEGWDNSWNLVYEMLAQDALYPDPQNLVVFTDNHDMSRVFTQLDEDHAKYQMALTYILTIRGIPQLFYGTEILMSNKGTDNHGIIRSDFPGGWEGDHVSAFSGKGLTPTQRNAQEFLRQLLVWRKSTEVIHHGQTMHYVPEGGIYVFFRYDNSKRIMVILNKNKKPVTLYLDRFKSMLGQASSGREIVSGKEIFLGTELKLNEAGPMVIEIDGGK